jgi:nitrogen fixation NifU-like protein
MSNFRELYQEMILDHNRNPRNFRELPDANRDSEGYNPLCGDHIHLYVKLTDGVIEEISFQGTGCAISKASASMMTSMVKGKRKEEAEALFQRFHRMVTGGIDSPEEIEAMGKLAVFSGVRDYPTRVKCATLSWHTLHAALEGAGRAEGAVTTE